MFPKAKQSKYYGKSDMEDSIEQNHGEPIAKAAKWDGHDIIDAISFFVSMFIGGPVGAKVSSLKEGMNENLRMFVNKFIKEVTHSYEYEDMSNEDENDKEEFRIGNYHTKYFHVCPGASSLYMDIESKGVDMDMAERSARLQDALFFVEEHIQRDGYKPEKDYIMVAKNLAKNIMKMAKMMGLEKEHSYIQGHVDIITKTVEGKKLEEKVIELTEKNVPTDPAKWAASKSAAKRKFDVYPSAYANAWAAKNYKGKGGGWRKSESLTEGISVFDERHFGKKGIIIMIDDNGKKVSAIFKDKKNADKYNRNNPSDIKKLLDLAKKTKYPKAIDESVNEGIEPQIKKIAYFTGTRPEAVEDFVSKHSLNITKLLKYVEKGKLPQRMELVSALAGRDGNATQKKVIKMFSESVNEAYIVLHSPKKGVKPVSTAAYADRKDAEKWAKDLGGITMIVKKKIKGIDESVNEARKVNPASKQFLKGMKKIKVKGLGGYMPGVDYVYVDGDKYYFVDFEGDHMELKNTNTIKQLHKLHGNSLGESINEAKEPEVITQLRKIVKNKQNDLIKDTKSGKKVRVDMNSANLMVQVYDALKQQSNKDKFVKSGIVSMGHMAYKLMKKENTSEVIEEAEYQGRKVELNKPMQGDTAKFKVYVKNDKGNVVKVNFGQKGMTIKKDNPEARKSFRARMNCDNPGPKWKARYWSCRKW